jgi:predicted Zn-dependent peptidase
MEINSSNIRFKKTVLDNGLTIVTEAHPQNRVVSIGIWINTGTRDEKAKEAGLSHLLEHMVFKGTKKRTAYQIAKSLESLGGELNAFTSRENTCYHATVLSSYWVQALDVLTDLVCNMSVTAEDFTLEKSVILQEISMSEDQLEELIYDRYLEKALPNSALSKPILGYEQSLNKITLAQLHGFYKEKYSPKNMVIAAAGNIDHSDFVSAIQKCMSRKKPCRVSEDLKKPIHRRIRYHEEKKVEQTHFLMGFPVSSLREQQRYEAYILNALLGGGMTSRLYQNIREKKGLVYSIYSSIHSFADFGLLNIYAASEPENMKPVIKGIASEIQKLKKNKITKSDLEMYRTQIKGSLLMGADDADNRMHSIAVSELMYGHYRSVEDVVADLDKVTLQSLNEFIKKWLDTNEISAVVLGAEADAIGAWLNDFDFNQR